MGGSFVPEMHDIGKMIADQLKEQLPTTDGKRVKWHGIDAFANVDWGSLGVAEPQTFTWQAFRYHHEGDYADLNKSPAAPGLLADMVLLMIADNLAATISRAVPQELRKSSLRLKRVHKLWNPRKAKEEKEEYSPVQDLAELRKLIEFVASDPADSEEFFARYGDYLLSIPEDKTPPSVVTSLDTHCRLVGKFYRVLKNHVTLIEEEGQQQGLKYGDIAVTTRWEAMENWRFQLVKYALRFPQKPVRARDLNLLHILEQHTRELLASELSDYVLFHTTDTLWLFLPIGDTLSASQLLKPYLKDGFYAEAEETTFNLANLYPDWEAWLEEHRLRRGKLSKEKERIRKALDGLRRREDELRELLESKTVSKGEKEELDRELRSLHQEIGRWEQQVAGLDQAVQSMRDESEHVQREVKFQQGSVFSQRVLAAEVIDTETICDLCQVREATEEWGDPEGRLIENLCDVCYRIRQESARFDGIARWEEREPGAQVAWVKVALNYGWAGFHIRLLFEEYVEQLVAGTEKLGIADAEQMNASLRPIALLADFTRDYKNFLESFFASLKSAGFAGERLQMISEDLKEFYVIKLRWMREILTIVSLFRDELNDFFPRCQQDCPVRLSISASTIKFPFFEHWNYLQAPGSVINIRLPGRATLEMDLQKLADLESIDLRQRRVNTFFHRLSEIESRTGSRLLTQAELLEAGRRVPEAVDLYASGRLDANEILSYYKIWRG